MIGKKIKKEMKFFKTVPSDKKMQDYFYGKDKVKLLKTTKKKK